MTDDRINDLVSAAARAHDADFGTPAIYAALKAATEDRIHLTDSLIDDRSDASVPPPERPYIGPRRRDIPRLQRRFLAAVAAIAFIATCAAGVALSQDDTPRELDKATTTTTVSVETLKARIIAAYRSALARNVMYTVTTWGSGQTTELWHDGSTGASRFRSTGDGDGSLRGKAARDYGPVTFDGTEPVGTRTVDHCFSDYVDNVTEPFTIPWDATANDFEEDLTSGRLVVDGLAVLDGRDTIRLSVAVQDFDDGYIWLDATTSLPLRAEGSFDMEGDYTETYEFLPRSNANLDHLVPPVPAGYAKVERVHPQVETVDAGCETFPG